MAFYNKICFESDSFIAFSNEWDWREKTIFIHTNQRKSQRWSAFFCATGVWGGKPIGRVRVNMTINWVRPLNIFDGIGFSALRLTWNLRMIKDKNVPNPQIADFCLLYVRVVHHVLWINYLFKSSFFSSIDGTTFDLQIQTFVFQGASHSFAVLVEMLYHFYDKPGLMPK